MTKLLLKNERAFILPLSLIILLIILIVSIWSYRGVMFDLWSAISQKESSQDFYAVESAAYKSILEKIIPAPIDFFPTDGYVSYDYFIPVGSGNVRIKVYIKNLGLTRICSRSTCCQRFEVKAALEERENLLVKLIAVKAIPDDERCQKIF